MGHTVYVYHALVGTSTISSCEGAQVRLKTRKCCGGMRVRYLIKVYQISLWLQSSSFLLYIWIVELLNRLDRVNTDDGVGVSHWREEEVHLDLGDYDVGPGD